MTIYDYYADISKYKKKIDSLNEDIIKLKKMREDTEKTNTIVKTGEDSFVDANKSLNSSYQGERASLHQKNYGVIKGQIETLKDQLKSISNGIESGIKELQKQIRHYEDLISECYRNIEKLENDERVSSNDYNPVKPNSNPEKSKKITNGSSNKSTGGKSFIRPTDIR